MHCWFCESTDYLSLGNIKRTSRAPFCALTDKKKIHHYVFYTCMKHKIGCQISNSQIIAPQTNGRGCRTPNSLSKDCTHVASTVPLAIALYSTFVLNGPIQTLQVACENSKKSDLALRIQQNLQQTFDNINIQPNHHQ